MVEEVRLESVYTPKGYREFESLPLRKKEEKLTVNCQASLFSFTSGETTGNPYLPVACCLYYAFDCK